MLMKNGQRLLALLTLPMLGCLATPEDIASGEAELQGQDAPLINGSVVPAGERRSAVLLYPWALGTSICTGTRVGPRHILTAAHCVLQDTPVPGGGSLISSAVMPEFAHDQWLGYTNAHSVPGDSSTYLWAQIDSTVVHPGVATVCGVGGCPSGQVVDLAMPDLAVITLKSDLDASVGSAKIDPSPLSAGQTVTVSGYGCEAAGGPTPNPQRYKAGVSTVMSTLELTNAGSDPGMSSLSSVQYLTTPGPQLGGGASTTIPGLCPGDSGGPLYRGANGAGPDELVGVNGSTSYQVNYHTRINNGLSSRSPNLTFLRSVLPASSFVARGGGFSRYELRDFDGDLRSDVLWHNRGTGQLSVWHVGNGGQVTGHAEASWTASDPWQIVGTGDFNRDGMVDVLWHDQTTGQLSVWYMNGLTVLSHAELNWTTLPSSGWRVVGVGDFDRNGSSDILWIHTSGELSVWFLDGVTATRAASLSQRTAESSGWTAVTVGDFNHDDYWDVLWHNGATGQVHIWYLNGTTRVSTAELSWRAASSTGWKIVGVGDFGQDGELDVLWHHGGDGRLSAWNLKGTTVQNDTILNWTTPSSSGWAVVSR